MHHHLSLQTQTCQLSAFQKVALDGSDVRVLRQLSKSDRLVPEAQIEENDLVILRQLLSQTRPDKTPPTRNQDSLSANRRHAAARRPHAHFRRFIRGGGKQQDLLR